MYSRADGLLGIDALQQLRFGVDQIHPHGLQGGRRQRRECILQVSLMRFRCIAKRLRIGVVGRLRRREVQQAPLRRTLGRYRKIAQRRRGVERSDSIFKTDGLLYLSGERPALIIRNLVDRH